nr:antimicrobial peptide [Charonia tritonis]
MRVLLPSVISHWSHSAFIVYSSVDDRVLLPSVFSHWSHSAFTVHSSVDDRVLLPSVISHWSHSVFTVYSSVEDRGHHHYLGSLTVLSIHISNCLLLPSSVRFVLIVLFIMFNYKAVNCLEVKSPKL